MATKIICDRCKKEENKYQIDGGVYSVYISMNRLTETLDIRRKIDLCTKCFDIVILDLKNVY